MKAFYAAIVSGAVGVGCLAALATMDPPSGQFTACAVKEVFEDGSFTMSCPPIADIDAESTFGEDPKLDFWEQLDLIREIHGEEYA